MKRALSEQLPWRTVKNLFNGLHGQLWGSGESSYKRVQPGSGFAYIWVHRDPTVCVLCTPIHLRENQYKVHLWSRGALWVRNVLRAMRDNYTHLASVVSGLTGSQYWTGPSFHQHTVEIQQCVMAVLGPLVPVRQRHWLFHLALSSLLCDMVCETTHVTLSTFSASNTITI